MMNGYFQAIECHQAGERLPLAEALEQLMFDSRGLIPVITQDRASREILMMAWMNREAIDATLRSGTMTYWSRSRSQLWRKGETSGHIQHLRSMRIDCDGDALLCEVEQRGPACHTQRPSCFYLEVDTASQSLVVIESPPTGSDDLVG